MRQKLLRVSALLLCAMALTAAYYRSKPSTIMADAAKHFLASLTPEQRAKATFPMDSEERLNWHFIPRVRKGLPLREMDGAQKDLAHAFLAAGLSQRGYMKATTIMSLDQILKDMEQGKGPQRDPEGYFFSVFGEPSENGTWGWRVEGHHVSLNFTVIKGQMIASSPSFFGANPAEVKQGPRKGLRTLAREEDLARELLASLDAKQKAIAVIDKTAPKDILTYNKRKVDPENPKGIAGSKLTKKQMEILTSLIEEYADNMPEEIAKTRMDAVHKAGMEKIYFAWAGGPDKGQGHWYQVQGPTFLIEYDNTQNDANHIHSVWRDFHGDFGEDLLAAHYLQTPHRAVAAGD
ncbi:MAG TPA: DUF3500 domain-containing protein [Bryobacterales bacterium]|jgi:hypothetical protein|nr:DUF3500 domain-containing protein [Bryobacterales bacterium]